ncbi:24142_t:CDS:2 [Gigaspora rosea]|nr:24142_t:CDS:2 [Gigaspora rosea]
METEDYIDLIEERSLNSNENIEIHNVYNVEIESENNIEPIEVCSSNTVGYNKDLTNAMKALVIGQTFGSWDELDHFISSYAKSQNFVSVIRHSGTSKTNIAKNQWQTRSKRIGCHWKVHASCPKMTGELKITSVCLNHNDYPITNDTNKFALKYRTFSEDMLKNVKF